MGFHNEAVLLSSLQRGLELPASRSRYLTLPQLEVLMER